MIEPRVGAGDVLIELGGEMYALVPTLNAIITMSRQDDGFACTSEQLTRLDPDAVGRVICLGLGRELPDLADLVYESGIQSLAQACLDYLTILMHGGRRPEPKPDLVNMADRKQFSLDDYANDLLEIALGWIGWPLHVALNCDMNAIEVARRGRVSILQVMFGKPKDGGTPDGEFNSNNVDHRAFPPLQPMRDAKGEPVKLTADVFDAMFGGGVPEGMAVQRPIKVVPPDAD